MKANLNRVWRVVIALVLVLSIGMVTAPPVAAAPAATFSPTSGPIGTSVTVSGTGWTALENILSVTVGGATAAKNLSVSASGVLTGTITIPTVSGGPQNIVIVGSTSGAQPFTNAFLVTGSATFSPSSGPVGTSITVTGNGWVASETIQSVTVGGATAAHTLTVNGSGALAGAITVPTVATGAKNIVIVGRYSGAQTFTSAFTVTASASFAPTSGPVGTSVTVTGSGWVASEAISGVTIGGATATHTLIVNGSGALSGTLTIPSLSTGLKNIVITGATSGAQSFTNAFTVSIAAPTFSPASGPVGTSVTVTGAGWVGSETISAVTVGGTAATHTLVVNTGGALSGSITVPSLTGGAKSVVITGSVSGTQTFATAFTVTPSAAFSPSSGVVGTVVTVSGAGWAASETISAATVGGTAATYTLTVNASGAISGTITIPSVTTGAKTIVLTGSTSGAQTFASAFTVTASASFSPTSGPVGTTITASGTGWGASEAILSVTVGSATASNTLTINGSGVLSGTITVPSITAGVKNIIVTGATSGAQTFTNAFTVTSAGTTFSPTSGNVGASVTVTGTGWVASETVSGVTVGGTAATHTLTVNSSGAISGTITVPTVTRGAKTIVITGSVSGAQTFTSAFTVTASATFSPTYGPVATVITVTGAGWTASEAIATVTVGAAAATNTLAINGSGVLTGSITVPTLTAGAKNIVINSDTFAGAFTVTTRAATFSPTSGNIGATITVTGTGWTPSETISAVTVGGTTATNTLTVSSAGALSGTIIVPSIAGGTTAKDIVITGSVSGAMTSTAAFTVTPTATFSPTAGQVGTTVTVSGTGWAASESISSVTVGDATAANTLSVNAGGVLSGTITIPSVIAGAKDIVITGATSGARTFAAAFTVANNTATFTPTSGPVTTSITVSGAGWAASEPISAVTVGGTAATNTLTVSAAGVLSGTITVPTLATGLKDIVITGATSGAKTFTGAFTVTAAATFSPSSGPVGTSITVTGSGWAASETISAVTVGGATATYILTVNGSGALTGTITVPALSTGAKTIIITGSGSGAQTFASAFTVAVGTTTFSPSSGGVGASVTVTGSGWVASEAISSVTVGGIAATNTLAVSAAGALTGTITVPAGLTAGAKDIVITGATSGAQTYTSAFTVGPAASFTPSSGPVSTSITVTGSGWAASETISAVTVGGTAATYSLTVSASGALSGTITVPSLSTGAKTIVITGSTSGAQSFASAFTVAIPAPTFTPTSGNVGATVTASGTGWVPSETISAVTVGGTAATNTLTVSAAGALTGTITVPSLTGGAKNVVITGSTSGVQTFTSAFTVTTAVILTPTTGTIATVVTVAGTGWAASETILSVTTGGATTAKTLSVDGSGVLSGTITIPPVSGGAKDIVFTGSTSGAQTFASAFTVTGSATFSPTSGAVGATVTVTGGGWVSSETISAVTVGGTAATYSLIVMPDGNISGSITIPSVAAGAKSIVITGSTSGAQTYTSAFTVGPSASFSPTSGPVGTIITTTGTGWAASEAITSVTIGGSAATNTLTVSAGGALSGTITVPTISSGAQDIVITGATSGAQTFTSAFTVATNTATFSPTTGPVGTSVTVIGAGWASSETIQSVTVGGATATNALAVSAGGALTGNIIIPAVTVGAKDIVIVGSTSGVQVFTSAFTVTASATFSPTSGPEGSSVTVTGAGWAASEVITDVTVGGTSVTSTPLPTVSAAGALSGTFTIPTGIGTGSMDIVITGATSGAQTFTGAFTVSLTTTFTPTSGPVGTSITVSGNGWDSTPEAITLVTVGGAPATNTLAVNSSGVLSGTITVPTLATGLKDIVITGTSSGAQTFGSAFTVVVGPASKLAFTTQPGSATAGSAFGTQPVVTVQDAAGNTVTSSAVAIILSIATGTGPSGATLSGTLSVNAVSGVATFSGLHIDVPGSGFVLVAGSASLTSATSNAFNVAAPSPVTSITLSSGWNLISLPLIPTDTSITSVLSGISSNVTSVWSYNASSGNWTSWNPTTGGDLTAMVDGKGYWINMSVAATLSISGTELPTPPAVPPTYSTSTGWNLVGFKSTTSKTAGAYLTGTDYRFPIYGYASGAYLTVGATTAALQPGQGYWVYFNVTGIISP